MEDKTNNKSNIIKIIAFIVIFGVVFGVVFGFIIFLTKDDNDTNTPTANPPVLEEPVSNEYFELNETLHYSNGLDIIIKSYSFESEFCGVKTSSSTDDVLCVVDVSLYNSTSEKIKLNEEVFLSKNSIYSYCLIFNDDYKYYQTYCEFLDFLAVHDEIKPLSNINAALCYKIPKSIKTSDEKLQVRFSLNKSATKQFYFWNLRNKSI